MYNVYNICDIYYDICIYNLYNIYNTYKYNIYNINIRYI